MADPRLLRAMSPLLGQFDPEFTATMHYAADAGSRYAGDTLGAT